MVVERNPEIGVIPAQINLQLCNVFLAHNEIILKHAS